MSKEKVRFRVLGPIQAIRNETPLAIGGPKQRLVLALLLVDAPSMVSTARLIDGVWDENPPESARKTLHGYVHHLRAAIGSILETDASGYLLGIGPADLDASLFEDLVVETQAILATDPESASTTLAQALAMWGGQPYADLDGALALEPEISRLSELRIAALELRIEADLEIGVDANLIGELDVLTQEYPLREPLRALHMRALYAAGRQAEALRAYEKTRRFLAEELGLDPTPALRDLEARILDHDPSLVRGPTLKEQRAPRALRGYELRERVGEGGIGTVFRAYQTSIGREVSLKVIRQDLADKSALIELFQDEARRLGALEHPNIVPLHDAWREPGAAYHVRRWMTGGNLRDRLDAQPLSGMEALRVLGDIGSALVHAHRQGFEHSRVKPSNVLFDDEGMAYLTDFSIAGARGEVATADDRMYLAPEIRSHGSPRGPATDVYSLGILAYELLTGAPPIVRADGTVLAPDLSHGYTACLAQATARDPQARQPRVEDFLRILRQAAGVDVVIPAQVPMSEERFSLRNPYKGLRAFQEADAEDFFGREEITERLVASLRTRRLVAVVGPSGVGKSSVVKAGLIPSLRADANSRHQPLLVTEMFPGTHPFEELASALLQVGVDAPDDVVADLRSDERGLLRTIKHMVPDDGSQILLVVDQFEELFTQVADETLRRMFLSSLVSAIAEDRTDLRIVVTMRADFYDRPLEYHEFGRLFEAGTVPVLAPSQDSLARAVAGPARAVGLELEPGLVSEIVHDVVDQPGALPLMQYALTELFERRTSDLLTTEAYRQTGGVLGALGSRAEELWQSFGPSGREVVRQTFLRLVTVDEGADNMRRRVRRSELVGLGVPQAELDSVLKLFGAHRLLSFDRDPLTRGATVEVAHEALLREWPRLRNWIEGQRQDLMLHRLLATELAEWESAERDASYLLRGGRLAQFELWERSTGISLTAAEQDFLDASRRLRESERVRERRTQRRLRSMLTGVSVLAVVALIAGTIASVQANEAQRSAEDAQVARQGAETRRLALQAPQLTDTNRQVALLLAVEAYQRDPDDPTTLGALHDVLVETGSFLGYVVPQSRPRGVGFTSVGDLVALSGTEVVVYERKSGRVIRRIEVGGADRLAVSPESNRVAVVDGSKVTVYDVLSQVEIDDFETGRTSPVTSLEFDRTGSVLAMGFEDGAVAVWTPAEGRVLTIEAAHPERESEGIEVPPHLPDQALFGTRALAFSDDGSLLATGGLVHVRVWDLTDPSPGLVFEVVHDRELPDGTRFQEAVRALRFARGRTDRLYAASSINVIEYSLDESTPLREIVFPNRINAVANAAEDETVALSDDAAFLAEAGGRVTRLSFDGEDEQFNTHLSGEPHIGLTADGGMVAVSNDLGVSTWSLRGHRLIATAVPAQGAIEGILSADGEWLVLSRASGLDITLYRRDGHVYSEVDLGVDGLASGFLGSGDGLITWGRLDGATRFWSFDSEPFEGEVLAKGRAMFSAAFSSDGRFFAAGATSDTSPEGAVVQVFDVTTLQPVSPLLTDLVIDDSPARTGVMSVSFSSDGKQLVGVNSEGRAVVWDTGDWDRPPRVLAQGGDQVVLAAYSPDGRYLVTTSADGTTMLRDPMTFEQLGESLVGQTSGVEGQSYGPAVTPDGRYMITTADGTGRIWDLEAKTQVGAGFPSSPNTNSHASRDGRWMSTFVGDEVVVWNLDFSTWAQVACRAAGRNLTLEEWEQFAPAEEVYRATCDMWPAATEGAS